MDVISDFKFILDRDTVLKVIDCYRDSEVYEEVCDIYKTLEKKMESIVEPGAIIKFIERTEKYDIDDVKDCSHIVCCILTLGKKVVDQIQEYFKNDLYLEGMLFDAIADILLSDYSSQLYKKVCEEAKLRGLGLTCKLSPGNNDFPLSKQGDILKELCAGEKLNISITEGYMLNPVKSYSFIFGADSELDIPVFEHECSRCTNTTCKMRKEPYLDKKSKDTFNLKVKLRDNEINISTNKSKNIMEILIENGVKISSPCAGNGTCGKCKVKVVKGKVNRLPNNSILGEELLLEGWCLACSTFLETDCVVLVNREEEDFNILDVFDDSNMSVNPCYNVLNINIEDKNFMGHSLTDIINTKLNSEYEYSLRALKKLQTVINSKGLIGEQGLLYGEGELSLIIEEDKILNVCSTKSSNVYGIAIDIGTTTIALSLINLVTGESIKNYSTLNSQKQFGADVITRIQNSNEGKMSRLNECIKNDLLNGIKNICSSSNIELEEIYHIAITGNTTMLYFLLGLSCESLALFPFNTITTSLFEYSFYDIFKDDSLDCKVTILPGVSAYVGADIVAGLLNCDFNNFDETCILIDIGTNGEMAIGNKNKILCLATAAGSAFEGANITCGVGGVKGAISEVDIRQGKIIYKTIGNAEPEGICGSAVIDITAACLSNDIIDETGLFDKDKYCEGYIKISKNRKNEDIIFNQKDVREVQLAKSAIRSGIEILLKEFNVSYADVDKIFLAGGFGYNMNVENAAVIGLIPQELKSKVKCVGNSSLGGAVRYLLNKGSRRALESILDITNYIDISSSSSFNDLFINNMLFL